MLAEIWSGGLPGRDPLLAISFRRFHRRLMSARTSRAQEGAGNSPVDNSPASGSHIDVLYKPIYNMPTELLKGTLDLLILRALSVRACHGLEIARRIEEVTGGMFEVKAGSLFPALHRLEERGWLSAEWGESEAHRRARYYRLTRTGRRQLETATAHWKRIAGAIARAIEATS